MVPRLHNEAGEVGLLYSPGFGAGWSTWNTDHGEVLLFHPALVEAAIAGVVDPDPILDELLGVEYYYSGGWSNVKVKWVAPGTQFYVNEYDGAESILLLSKHPPWVA